MRIGDSYEDCNILSLVLMSINTFLVRTPEFVCRFVSRILGSGLGLALALALEFVLASGFAFGF